MAIQKPYDVALSFAGSDRPYVEKVARNLRDMGVRIFYDGYEDATMWGKNLHEHLEDVFCRRSRFVVIFLSREYRLRVWTRHERRAALERAIRQRAEYVLPARFDNTAVPGIGASTAFVDLRKYSPRRFAELIREKIGHVPRRNFVPEIPDRFYQCLRVRRTADQTTYRLAIDELVDRLSHVPQKGRRLLFAILELACAAGVPENAHVKLAVLKARLHMSRKEITSLLAEMDWAGIRTRLYSDEGECGDSSLIAQRETLEIKYRSGDVLVPDNATFILFGVRACLQRAMCDTCARRAFLALDFSALGMHTTQPHHAKVDDRGHR